MTNIITLVQTINIFFHIKMQLNHFKQFFLSSLTNKKTKTAINLKTVKKPTNQYISVKQYF